MRAASRLLPAALLLGGCEAQLAVDVTDGPVDTADQVVLDITHVALQTEDGDVVRFGVDQPVDLLLYRKGETFRLLDGKALDNGRYTGIALDFGADSLVVRNDGTEVAVVPPVTRRFAPIDMTVDDLDEEQLVLDLELRFSLVDSGSGDYDLAPVLRAVHRGKTGVVIGAVASTLVESTACRNGRPVTAGVAVYAFRGSNVTPADYAGQASLIASANVEFDDAAGQYRYELHFLPPDDYTLALTCQADDDNPASDDAVTFDASANVTVPEDGTVTLDFT